MSGNISIDSDSPDSTNSKIFRAVADVFQSAQSTYAGHRRHIAVLKRIQSKAVETGYEEVFNYWFNKMVTLILPLKRTEIVGDRIVRLVAGLVASLEHELEAIRDKQEEFDGKEKVFSRFVDQFIRHILRGVESREKNVRYRVAQLLAVIMDNIGEIDEDLYKLIMWSFEKRLFDKEPPVRIQAIFCLTKFQDEDNASETMDEASTKLIHAIRNDPSAEVRRAAMLNLVSLDKTKNIIMERARDVNPVNRRIIYTRVLKNMGASVFQELDEALIAKLITWGLEDREEAVRNACVRLVAFDWLNLMDGDIIKLLSELNVTSNNVCEKVLDAIFTYREDTVAKIKLPENVWDSLTAEITFLIRAFHAHCMQHKLEDIIDDNFPEASRLSEILQKYMDLRFSNNELSKSDVTYLEFIIEQLLSVAFKFDYSDEIGRRAMLMIIRNALANYSLTAPIVKIALQVLKVLSINERDFIAMTVEIITDIRDEDIEKQEAEEANRDSRVKPNEDEDDEAAVESFHSAVDDLVNNKNTPVPSVATVGPEKEVSPHTLLACLTMSQYMLELIHSSIDENVMISSLIDTLITPAVRSTQSEVRELGVRNLGLCSLLDVNIATESLYLFGMCVSKGDAGLKTIALKVIADIFSVHGTKVVDGEGKVDSISLHKIFYKTLKNCELPECQATVAEGLCKLFLGDVFIDDDLFETLILSYFSPANSQNEALVQAFAFCLPVYCYSHIRHQKRMVRVAGDVLLRLSVLWDELQTNDDNSMPPDSMLKPNVILQELIEWTDPRKVVNQTEEHLQDEEDTQLDFLLNILRMYYKFERKEVKKMILTNINRFTFQDRSIRKWKEVREILEDISDNDDIDSTSRTSISKFLFSLQENILSEDVDVESTRDGASDVEEQLSTSSSEERMSKDEKTDLSPASLNDAKSNVSMADEEKPSVTSDAPSQVLLPSASDTVSSEENSRLRSKKRNRADLSDSESSSDREKSNRMVSFVLPEPQSSQSSDSSYGGQLEDSSFEDDKEE
ncbi:LAFA_0G18646g1_1 [Lachancea sp. 'fantastica']|nr:LAFA_0G18646g1_1 [Lachancea sp. 'fantastica']